MLLCCIHASIFQRTVHLPCFTGLQQRQVNIQFNYCIVQWDSLSQATLIPNRSMVLCQLYHYSLFYVTYFVRRWFIYLFIIFFYLFIYLFVCLFIYYQIFNQSFVNSFSLSLITVSTAYSCCVSRNCVNYFLEEVKDVNK